MKRFREATKQPHIAAVDLFCGAGGLTRGLRNASIDVTAGIDLDPACKYPIEANNPGTRFVLRDVADVQGRDLEGLFPRDSIRVLAGCAPCQPFSRYTVRADEDPRWKLLGHFLRLVLAIRPHAITMENVPELHERSHPAYEDFVRGLERAGYAVMAQVVRCADFGVPQTRQRLVLLAGRDGRRIELLRPRRARLRTVRDAIGRLPPTQAGAPSPVFDPLHVAPALSPLNLERIRATPEGGGWRDWAEELRLACHQRDSGRYYGSVYGRMSWTELAPTMTTQCYGYGNGRFGHPEQDRAITLREAALLQTFPKWYRFLPRGVSPTYAQIGRLIGNAVPVALGKAIGRSLVAQLR